MEENNKKISEKLTLTREELKAQKSALAFTKSHCQHETRKNAKEMSKMKERLLKLMNEKMGSAKNNMICLNPLSKSTLMALSEKSKLTGVSFFLLFFYKKKGIKNKKYKI